MTTFVTVERAAPALDMTRSQVWRAIRENQFPFPYVRIGKQIRIDARAIGLITPDGPADEQKEEGGEIETPDSNQ